MKILFLARNKRSLQLFKSMFLLARDHSQIHFVQRAWNRIRCVLVRHER